VLNTYRVWLRYELFRGGISYEGFRKSEDNLMQFITMRGNTKPHLAELVVPN
jgi:3'-5' exonuclease